MASSIIAAEPSAVPADPGPAAAAAPRYTGDQLSAHLMSPPL